MTLIVHTTLIAKVAVAKNPALLIMGREGDFPQWSTTIGHSSKS
jgi:hypothetical protein